MRKKPIKYKDYYKENAEQYLIEDIKYTKEQILYERSWARLGYCDYWLEYWKWNLKVLKTEYYKIQTKKPRRNNARKL